MPHHAGDRGSFMSGETMTAWKEYIKTLTFPFGITAEVCTMSYYGTEEMLELSWLRPPRDNPNAPPISIGMRTYLPPYEQIERAVIDQRPSIVRHAVIEFVLHELDEGLLFDGVRVFDPHQETP